MPKVSVILTCYNHKEFIWEAIKSVVNQTFSDRELLIWDDSPDNVTWEIIQEYIKMCNVSYPKKIQAWHHEENKWIIRNMEFLIWKSKWNYIVTLEGDDVLYEDYLDKKLEIFDRMADVMLVYNELDIINSKWAITSKCFLKNNRKILKFYEWEKVIKEDFFNSFTIPYFSWSTIMFDRRVLSGIWIWVQWMHPFNIISDYNFFLRVWVEYPIYWIEKSLTKYRVHENNITNNWNFRLVFDLYNLFSLYKKSWFISDEIRKRISTRYLRVICYESYKNMIKISSKESFINLWKYIYLKIFKNRF